MPNGVEYVSSIPDHYQPPIPLEVNMPVGFNQQIATVTGLVTIQGWPDDSLYITMYATYDCGIGPETINTQIEIEPIPQVVVTKEQISDNPRNFNDMVTYEVTLENIGSATAQGYGFYDQFPAELLFAQATFGNNGPYNPILVGTVYSRSGSYLDL